MDGVSLLPETAWDQAVFASMFFLLVIFVFSWIQKVRKEDQQVRKEDQEFQSRQQKEWQAFMEKQDDKWRAFNKEQRECNNKAMSAVENSVRDIVTVTQGMVSEMKEMRSDTSMVYQMLIEHDDKSNEIIRLIQHPQDRSRIKKQPEQTEEDIC